jgi:hypothetical protein
MTFEELRPGILLKFVSSTEEFLLLITKKNETHVFFIVSLRDANACSEDSEKKENWDDAVFIYAKAKRTSLPSHKHRFITQILDGDMV